MKKILVPTDFSPCAEKAQQFAFTIAEKGDVEIILLHACNLKNEPKENVYQTAVYTKPITQTAATKLEVLKKHLPQTEGVRATVQLVEGDVVEAIAEAEKQYGVDLIVMGTQGASGFKKLLMGSKTTAVISQASAPVMAIPAAYTGTTISHILLALNHSSNNLQYLKPVFELAALFNAQLHVAIFSASEEAATYIDDRRTLTGIEFRLQDAFPGQNFRTEHLTGSSFEEALQAYIDNNSIDLLVMVTHKRTGMEGLFNKSQTREMAYHTTVPLMAIQEDV